MLFKNQDLIHLQEQREANSEVLETGVLLRFENKQSSADMVNHGGIQREDALLFSLGSLGKGGTMAA